MKVMKLSEQEGQQTLPVVFREAHVRPTLEIVMVESPKHLRRKVDPASGLALLDLASETADDGC